MKKMATLFLVLVLCLTGCRGKRTASSSSEGLPNNSSLSTNNETSVYTTPPDPAYFPFSCDSVDKFVAWAKSGGTKIDTDNPGNQKFLEWRKKSNSLLMPVFKNNDFRLQSIVVHDERAGYSVSYASNPESPSFTSYKYLYITFTALTKEQTDKGVDYVADKVISLYKTIPQPQTEVKSGKSPWGEFRYVNAKDKTGSIAWFTHSSFFIMINTREGGPDVLQTEPWTNDYFNYFDLKTVSLK